MIFFKTQILRLVLVWRACKEYKWHSRSFLMTYGLINDNAWSTVNAWSMHDNIPGQRAEKMQYRYVTIINENKMHKCRNCKARHHKRHNNITVMSKLCVWDRLVPCTVGLKSMIWRSWFSHIQSTLDISKLWGLFFTSSNYPKCKLICTSGKLDL